MTPLRHAIIGVGAGVLSMHRPALELDGVELVGASDINAEVGATRAETLGCPFFADHRQMLTETKPDVTIILTPHPFHAPIAIDALKAGSHVLVEKPMAVHVAEADAMIAAAEASGRLLAVSFQQRTRPEVRAAHRLIGEGRLGQIQHIHMVAAWTRTAAYYRMGGWRGTWAGEGAGVLLNQAPHNLDLICHLAGLPARVVAWTRNLLHPIECEDTVQAMFEWPDGALGTIHISTAEAGRPERLEILGTRGYLQLQPGRLSVEALETELGEFIAASPQPFSAPASQPLEIELEPGEGGHLAIHQNLHRAILEGEPLITSGHEARMSLELANAMIYSNYRRQEVSLPLDREAYVALLERLKGE